MANILDEVQTYIADKLNSNPALSACPFIVENSKSVDYEIKKALGKQGVCGLVLTPKATFAGAFQDVGLAWQLDELEINIVESVTVNRGKKDGYITGQDASMIVFDTLCPLSGENEGQFSPVSYEEGEDGGLLVNRCILKCLVHPDSGEPPAPWFPSEQGMKFRDGTFVPVGDTFFALGNQTTIQNTIQNLGYSLSDIVEIDVFSYLNNASGYKDYLTSVYVDESCPRIGSDTWSRPFAGSQLEKVVFRGRTYAEVEAMAYYPWGLQDTSKIVAEPNPDQRLTLVTYVGGHEAQYSLSGTLNSQDLPSRSAIHYVRIGSSIDEIGDRAFRGMEFLMGVEIPTTVTAIGTDAFAGAEGMTDIEIPSSVSSIGSDAFFGCNTLSSVMFKGKTLEQVQAMDNYPWGIADTSIIHADPGPVPPPVDPTELTWVLSSGTLLLSADIEGMYENLVWPFDDAYGMTVLSRRITDLSVGSKVTDLGEYFNYAAWSLSSVTLREGLSSIGEGAFDSCSALISVAVPSSVTQIGEDAFRVDLSPSGKDALSSLQLVLMRGKTADEVSSMANWPWGIPNPEIISAELS